LVTLLFHRSFAADLFGSSFAEWWTLNAEAWAAMLLIPLWFDVVARKPWPKSAYWMAAWAAMLVLVPFVISSQLFGDHTVGVSSTMQFFRWASRTTEAFVAALIAGLYFAVWRYLPRLPWSRAEAVEPALVSSSSR
jgi:hypothetical protein